MTCAAYCPHRHIPIHMTPCAVFNFTFPSLKMPLRIRFVKRPACQPPQRQTMHQHLSTFWTKSFSRGRMHVPFCILHLHLSAMLTPSPRSQKAKIFPRFCSKTLPNVPIHPIEVTVDLCTNSIKISYDPGPLFANAVHHNGQAFVSNCGGPKN